MTRYMVISLLKLGFKQHFPQVAFFTRDNIHVKTDYKVQKGDIIQDTKALPLFCNKVTIFDLPTQSSYLFTSDKNTLDFINENT